MHNPIKLFYSYSTIDESYKEELEKALVMLKRHDSLMEWHFRQIPPGHDWDKTINEKLINADIILLLISMDFLNSDYCYEIEVTKALQLHDESKAIVIPIILRDCDWKHEKSPFKHLEALPKNAKPIKQWSDSDSAYLDITNRLKSTIKEIKAKKNSETINETKPTVTNNQSNITEENETIRKGVEVWLQEKDRINFNSTIEELENYNKICSELFSKIFSGEVDQKIKNTPSLKSKIPIILFNNIYKLEKLDDYTIQEIEKIRGDKTTYKWYERKILISALTISLISSKKLDQKKIHLLLDFLTDFEDIVWENALAGIVISLVYHQNKWERFNDLKKRLEHLRELSEVQNGLKMIDFIFRNKLYKLNALDPKIYNLPFFELPVNCFMPFYDDNPILENALNNNNTSIDAENFVEYVTKLPFLDPHKYSLCLGMESGTIAQVKLNSETKRKLVNQLTVNNKFFPFQNIISEYFYFFAYSPKGKIEGVFRPQISITATKLKSIILDKTNELMLTSDRLMDEERFHEALLKLEDLLKIEPENMNALWKISRCYRNLKKPDYHQSLKYLMQLNEIDKKNTSCLSSMAVCYSLLKDWSNAIKFIEESKEIDPKNKSTIKIMADIYYDKYDYIQALKIYSEGKDLYPNDFDFLYGIGSTYEELEFPELSKDILLESLQFCPPDKLAKVYRVLASNYVNLEDNSLALKYAELCRKNETDKQYGLITLGRIHLIGKIDLKIARLNLEKALSMGKSAILYGNLGHLELCESNELKAIDYYKNCVLLFSDINDFVRKFNIDLPYIIKYGISEKKYNNIREEMIEFWKQNKKH